jgi:hypothetical protein
MLQEFNPRKFQRGLEPTPYDELTGMPLPILPFERFIDVNPCPANEISPHHAAHPRDREELINTPNGDVTRTVRMQTVEGPGGSVEIGHTVQPWHKTHQRYHYFCSGPEWLPATEDEQFTYNIWAGSLYVPRYGLDVSGKKMVKKKLNEHQIELLHRGQIYVAEPGILRNFLRNYVLERGLQHIENKTIDEFVATPDVERKQRLGRKILALASELAAEPINSELHQARKIGYVHPIFASKNSNIVWLHVSQGNRQKIVEHVEKKIAA